MKDTTPGARVREIRKRRGMTQSELAGRARLSLSAVKKIEQGSYSAGMRGEMARRLAVALDVTVTDVLDGHHDAPVPEPGSGERWEPVRLALEGQHAGEAGEPALAAVQADFAALIPLHQAGRFAELGALLPPLLRDSDALVAASPAGGADAALVMRAKVRQLTGALMLHQWQFPAAERAFGLAMADAPDPLTKMAVADERAWGLIRQGRLAETADLSFGLAAVNEPKMTAPREDLAAYAKLLIRGAMAAVRDNRPGESADALRLARMAAAGAGPYFRLPGSWHGFGPVSVAIAAAEAAMIQDRPDAVLSIAERLGATRADSPLWHGAWSFMLDVACAHATLRQDEQAVAVLRRLRYDWPQWFPRQRYAADILDMMIKRRRTLTAEIRDLADAAKVPL
jgi:transcriptional regulator with XRE-family HTH domain